MGTISTQIRWADNTSDLARNLKEGLDQVEALKSSADRLVKSFGGEGLFRSASNLTAAIDTLGGVTKLTDQEQQRALGTLDKAIEKYQLMGKVAPTAMTDLAGALKAARLPSDQLAVEIERLSKDLGGGGLISQANAYVGAIEKIGGTSKLTAAQQASANTVLQQALTHYQKLGQEAPPSMVALAASMKPVQQNASLAEKATGLLSGSVAQLAAAFTVSGLIANSVGTLVSWTGEAIRGAGALVDLAGKTGLTIETLQRFQYAGKQSSVSVDDFADAAFKLGVRLAGGTSSVKGAVDKLGLSYAELRSMKPDEQFGTIERALEGMGNEQERNRLGVELFGKSFGKIAPAIADGYSKIAEQARVASGEQVKAIDAASDRWDAFVANSKSGLTSWIGNFLIARDTIAKLTDEQTVHYQALLKAGGDAQAYLLNIAKTLANQKDIQLPAPEKVIAFTAQLKAAQAELAGLSQEQRTNIAAALQLGKSTDDVTNAFGLSEGALKLFKEQLEQHKKTQEQATEAAKKFATAMAEVNSVGQGWRGTLDTISGAVVEAIKYYLSAGVSQNALAEAYGLTAAQVKSVVESLKDESQALGIVEKARADSAQSSLKFISDELAAEVKYADEIEKATLHQLETREQFHRDATTAMQRDTMGRYDFERAQIDKWVADQTRSLNTNVDGWEQALDDIDVIARAKYQVVAQAEADAFADMKAQELTWSNGFQSILGDLPKTMMSSLTGGGGLGGFGKAMESSIGSMVGGQLITKPLTAMFNDAAPTLLSGFGMTMTTAIGGAIPFIGSAIGALAPAMISGFKKLFGGVSQAELDGRKVEAAFEQSFGGFQAMMNAVGAAYVATGRSAQQAQADVAALMAAEKQGGDAAKAALDKINQAFDEQRQDAADLDAAIQKYGFSIDQLGPTMQKQNLDGQAKDLMNDWRLLVGSGIDIVTVDQKMAASTWDYLQMAKKTGMEVPVAMQPVIQSMLDQGVFTDENGDKLTDMAQLGITFSETMTQGFDKVVAKLQQLLEKIGMVPAALASASGPLNIDVNLNGRWNIPEGPDIGSPAFASRGGLITNRGVQYLAGGGPILANRISMPSPRGIDTVPIMGAPGEGVVNRFGMATLGTEGLADLNHGGGRGGGMSVAGLEARLDRLAASHERLAQSIQMDLPRQLARATRDASQDGRIRR